MKVFLSFLFMFICIALGAYIVYRVQTGQSIIPSFATAGKIVQIDDLDPRFKFVSSPSRTAAGYPRWDQVNSGGSYVLRGGTAQQCNGLNNAGCYATLDLSNQNFAIDQITLGFSTGPNRTSVDLYVDDKKVASFDSHDSVYTIDYHNYKLWKSPAGSIDCGKHKIKLVPNQKTGTAQKAFTLDFADVRTCTPSDGGDWQKIENTDSRIDYGGNNPSHQNLPFWDIYNNSNLSGGSSHACRTDINSGCRAVLNLTTPFDQINIRALKGFNATSADIYIDGQKIGEADASKNSGGIGGNPPDFLDWTSNTFACGTHTLKIVPNGRTGQNAKSFTMDYLRVKNCSSSQTKVRIEDNDTRFQFTSWDELSNSNTYKASGGTFHQTPWSTSPQFPQSRATLDLTSPSVNFNKFTFGYIGGTFRSTVDIFVDGQKLSEVNTNSSSESDNFADYAPWWTSPAITCAPHKIEFKPTAKTGQLPYRTINLDFVDIYPCTPEGNGETPSFLACRNNACVLSNVITQNDPGCVGKSVGNSCSNDTTTPTEYLICQNNACTLSTTVSSDDPSCANLNAGDTCGVPSTELQCQGNTDAPARCFDCKKDSSSSNSSSEINILDFSCFAKFYGKEVGKN